MLKSRSFPEELAHDDHFQMWLLPFPASFHDIFHCHLMSLMCNYGTVLKDLVYVKEFDKEAYVRVSSC